MGLFACGAVTSWAGYRLTRPHAVHFPADCKNVGYLVRHVLAHQYWRIAKRHRRWHPEEVLPVVVRVIGKHIGLDPVLIKREHYLVDDLGMDR